MFNASASGPGATDPVSARNARGAQANRGARAPGLSSESSPVAEPCTSNSVPSFGPCFCEAPGTTRVARRPEPSATAEPHVANPNPTWHTCDSKATRSAGDPGVSNRPIEDAMTVAERFNLKLERSGECLLKKWARMRKSGGDSGTMIG